MKQISPIISSYHTLCSSKSEFYGGLSIVLSLLHEANNFEDFYSELHSATSDPSLIHDDKIPV